MDIPKTLNAIRPLRGDTIPIRTVQETRPVEEFGDAYVAEVDIRGAAKLIKALDSKYPRDAALPLSHLRRFAKREILPPTLRAAIEAAGSLGTADVKTIFVVISPPLPASEELQELLAPFAPGAFSFGPSGATTPGSSPEPSPPKIPIFTIQIPLQPPFNLQQAERWSSTLWPVVFNPAAPRSTVAPPPQVLNRALDSIQPRAGYYLSLARKVAAEAKSSGRGRGVGAVIVDPSIEAAIEAAAEESGESSVEQWMNAVITVGGDVRFARSEAGKPSQADLHHDASPNPACAAFDADLEGGPDLHAMMRAIELLSRRRREDPNNYDPTIPEFIAQPVVETDPQLSLQLSPLESYFLSQPIILGTADNASTPPFDQHQPESYSVSPKKRKHEEPNPESTSVSLDPVDADSFSQTAHAIPTTPPLPAPPPLAVADMADPTVPHHPNDAANVTSAFPVSGAASRIRSRAQGGYLCTDLDVYISHEPCVCCSMGMLLSRFRAVIFPRSGRMKTGGLASEPCVAPVPNCREADSVEDKKDITDEKSEDIIGDRHYYGLHWRKELNWRVLGFEFVDEDEDDEESEGDDVVFNA
ncbi:hypothetical protein N7466_007042 [Penicillium verhagenii]|uniref:uncharacterized protein n=1 Tax=Penicillium verhagenii TaxID=1562060 RepID=UPI002544F217|nr:uncharacterized protein N7466_007042 [Penicillium verhagenii]KAJ5928086.1 hypothetical protein N7466_007042 [Penicillium verhagenii]